LEALKNFRGIDDPKRTGEYLDIAQHELTRLSVLTEKVLTMSLFDEKGIRIEYEKVNLEQLINEALNSLSLVFEKHHAKMEFIKTGDDFCLEGSAVHLTNVIHNLLDNAMKYSPSSPEIRISLSDLGTNLSLAVSDKGVGIPGEFHDKVFEKFFRMPTGDVHTIKGYGLGLSYVDSVVKSHGGRISVTSVPGEGSTFTIVLPKANKQ
jgi:signal transduction histidine kinase